MQLLLLRLLHLRHGGAVRSRDREPPRAGQEEEEGDEEDAEEDHQEEVRQRWVREAASLVSYAGCTFL